jgi:outer membrane immunogenic protein
MRRILLSVVMCVAVSAAQAADLSDLPILRGGYSDGLATSRVNWQGVYVGGQGGVGTSNMNFTGATQQQASRLLFDTAIENAGGVAEWPLLGKESVHGNGIGGFIGYNSQWDDIILGVELNYLHGKFGGSQTDSMSRIFSDSSGAQDTVTNQATASVNISDMGTLRLRAGYAWGVFLPYVFGGTALGQADIVRTARIFGNQHVAGPPVQDFPFDISSTDAQNSHLIYGYAGGLGMDVMLISCLFLRAEWEYVRFTSAIDTSVNTFKVGLGYKF